MSLLGASAPGRSLLSPSAAILEAPRPSTREEATVEGGRAPWVLVLLVLALLLPTELSLNLGGLRLTPYRIVLLWTFLPTITGLGAVVGRLHLADRALIGFCGWALIALLLRDGPVRMVESGGIFLVESLGAYLLARRYVRSAADLLAVARLLFLAMVVLALVAIPESLTGERFVHDIAGGLFGNRPPMEVEGRLGLERAYGPFDHPILYGTFCAAGFSLSRVASGAWPNPVKDLGRAGIVALAALASLSSGCIMAVLLQMGLASYSALLRGFAARWKLLSAVLISGYCLVSLVSDRSGLKAILWYVTLSRDTAAYRIMIWDHAGENISRHPLLGIGVENWVRPSWMPESVDSFWLVLTLNFGLPAVAMLVVGVVWLLFRAGRAQGGLAERRLRSAWCMTFAALLFTGFTVHYWNNMFVLFFFLLGCGGWFADDRPGVEAEA